MPRFFIARAFWIRVNCLAALWITGCGSSDTPYELSEDTAVVVVQDHGSYSLVRDSSDKEFYVRTQSLRHEMGKDPVAADGPEANTRYVMAATPVFYDEMPSTPPPLPKPREEAEIRRERGNIAALYLTDDGRRVYVRRHAFREIILPETGDIARLARTCVAPDCPAKDSNDGPILFVYKDPASRPLAKGGMRPLHPEGTSREAFTRRTGGQISPTCPACLKQRHLETESAETKRQYQRWVKPYVLPQTRQRLEHLDEELRRARHKSRRNNNE